MDRRMEASEVISKVKWRQLVSIRESAPQHKISFEIQRQAQTLGRTINDNITQSYLVDRLANIL